METQTFLTPKRELPATKLSESTGISDFDRLEKKTFQVNELSNETGSKSSMRSKKSRPTSAFSPLSPSQAPIESQTLTASTSEKGQTDKSITKTNKERGEKSNCQINSKVKKGRLSDGASIENDSAEVVEGGGVGMGGGGGVGGGGAGVGGGGGDRGGSSYQNLPTGSNAGAYVGLVLANEDENLASGKETSGKRVRRPSVRLGEIGEHKAAISVDSGVKKKLLPTKSMKIDENSGTVSSEEREGERPNASHTVVKEFGGGEGEGQVSKLALNFVPTENGDVEEDVDIVEEDEEKNEKVEAGQGIGGVGVGVGENKEGEGGKGVEREREEVEGQGEDEEIDVGERGEVWEVGVVGELGEEGKAVEGTKTETERKLQRKKVLTRYPAERSKVPASLKGQITKSIEKLTEKFTETPRKTASVQQLKKELPTLPKTSPQLSTPSRKRKQESTPNVVLALAQNAVQKVGQGERGNSQNEKGVNKNGFGVEKGEDSKLSSDSKREKNGTECGQSDGEEEKKAGWFDGRGEVDESKMVRGRSRARSLMSIKNLREEEDVEEKEEEREEGTKKKTGRPSSKGSAEKEEGRELRDRRKNLKKKESWDFSEDEEEGGGVAKAIALILKPNEADVGKKGLVGRREKGGRKERWSMGSFPGKTEVRIGRSKERERGREKKVPLLDVPVLPGEVLVSPKGITVVERREKKTGKQGTREGEREREMGSIRDMGIGKMRGTVIEVVVVRETERGNERGSEREINRERGSEKEKKELSMVLRRTKREPPKVTPVNEKKMERERERHHRFPFDSKDVSLMATNERLPGDKFREDVADIRQRKRDFSPPPPPPPFMTAGDVPLVKKQRLEEVFSRNEKLKRAQNLLGKYEAGLRGWLEKLGLERYFDNFEKNEVDEDVLPLLTLEDLKEMGILAVGSRRKLYTAILELGKSISPKSINDRILDE